MKRRLIFRLLAPLICLAFASHLRAEQLPVKTYTIADGLARDYVSRIKQDSHGYMWFCTGEGISRFDGYGFTNYGIAEGLPHRLVDDFLETHDGLYLFATEGGLVQFHPRPTNPNDPRFTIIPLGDNEASKSVVRLAEDSSGAIWCATGNGLYRLTRTDNSWHPAFIDKDSAGAIIPAVNALSFDNRGSLWLATGAGLYRRWPDGSVEHYTTRNGLSQDGISVIVQDRDGRIWVGTGDGLTLLVKDPRPNERIAERVYTTKDGLLNNFISALCQSSDGRLWIGTRGGLNLLVDPKENNGLSFRSYTTAQGLRNIKIWSITEDRDRNLWLGAESGGAMRIPHAGFTSYFETDGLGDGRITQVFSDHDGNVHVLSNPVNNWAPVIVRFDGGGFVKESPNLPPKTELSWGWSQLILQDREGDWWIPTAQGIYRFSGHRSFSELANARPARVYTVKDGMDNNAVFRLFEDARGDLWFGTLGSGVRALHRWERSSDKIFIYTPENNIPASGPTAFASDNAGNVWIGFYGGGVARYANGHFTLFTESDGLPAGFVRYLFFDSKGRLWIATSYSGLSRVDNPQDEKPQFVNLTVKDGISSNQVTTVAEDKWGQIYLGTGRGIDRLDPNSGKIKHYTTVDGLADNFINVCLRDSRDVLWFGTLRGLSRFVPEQDKPDLPPPIVLSGLRIAGTRQTLSELGETDLTVPELSYRQNELQIDFLSLGYASGDVLRYQFKFDGAGSTWSAPTEQRTITLANLSSGSYRFLVRAVNSDGVTSSQPASVTFRILPPIWLRWWFMTLVTLVLAATVYWLYRYRMERLREVNAALAEANRAEEGLGKAREERLAELERVRTRIATDLHDDIGASLTQIAILSEVARQQSTKGNGAAVEPLKSIAHVSNELVETMSDIVWAINPRKDHLQDLIQRMRRFASDLLPAKGINLEFRVPTYAPEIPLGANARREVFLIFKESLTNVVKHAGASRVKIEFDFSRSYLTLRITDNGRGFDLEGLGPALLARERGGHGIFSMKKRAAEMNGRFDIKSEVGHGTVIDFQLPLSEPVKAGG
jgi:signal transduction histidine kinase/ligand-binding sensor domain-containing protein